jgi:hypothetical protein
MESEYIEIGVRKENWICHNHNVMVAGGKECPLCHKEQMMGRILPRINWPVMKSLSESKKGRKKNWLDKKAYQKNYLLTHPEIRENNRTRAKEYYHNHRMEVLAKIKAKNNAVDK